jgi:hypothetical protein
MKSKYLFTLYVGANNRTHRVERAKAIKHLIDSGIKGMTVRNCDGVWRGGRESSIAVEIVGSRTLTKKLEKIQPKLCIVLKQQAILITRVCIMSSL